MKFFFLFFLTAAHAQQMTNMDAPRPAPMKGMSVYNVDAKWSDQNGTSLRLSEFKGAPVLVAMVYTSCQAACPLIVSEMQAVESKVSKGIREKTKFVLVSFDPGRDTPKTLKEFASARKLDLHRWRLLTGSEAGIRQLAAVLGVRYHKGKNGDYSHSNVVTLLDSEGIIRDQKTGLDPGDQSLVHALEKL